MKKTCIILILMFSFFLCFATANASNESRHKLHLYEMQGNINNVQSELDENHSCILLAQADTAQNESRLRDPEKFHEMIAWRFIKYLDLNEEQSAQFIPIFMESNRIRGKLSRQSRKLVDAVAKDVDDKSVSIEELKKQLAQIKKLNKDVSDEHDRFLKKLEDILTERQSVKLEIFEDKFKNDLYNRFRESNRRQREENQKNQSN